MDLTSLLHRRRLLVWVNVYLYKHRRSSLLLSCPRDIYVVFRPSVGWEDCGGSCTLCGSMWADYMLGSSCWSGRRMPLDKLHRTSTSLEEPIMQRKRKRSCPNSHPPALHHHFYSCALTQFTGVFFFFLAPFWCFYVGPVQGRSSSGVIDS